MSRATFLSANSSRRSRADRTSTQEITMTDSEDEYEDTSTEER